MMGRPRQDQFVGCMLGLAAGDAAGAPYEGMPNDLIFQCFGSREKLLTPPDITVLHYTDDTQMTIGVAEALIQDGGSYIESLAEQLFLRCGKRQE